MPTYSPLPRLFRCTRTASLTAALGFALAAAPAFGAPERRSDLGAVGSNPFLPAFLRVEVERALVGRPAPNSPTNHVVTSCADDGSPGTLRSIIEDTANTLSGDSIDLTMLPLGCSEITLDTGAMPYAAIRVHQDTLHIHGPGAKALTIDAPSLGKTDTPSSLFGSSIFYHFGHGTLGISDVTIAGGVYVGPTQPYGGCISSTANVLLIDSVVTSCAVISTSAQEYARGGAIYAHGYLTLFNSEVSRGFVANYAGGIPYGGGVFAQGSLDLYYSTIRDNTADGLGGGVMAVGGAVIVSSTIANNAGEFVGGIDIKGGTANITDSTISGNWSIGGGGGLRTLVPTTIANSTVAMNWIKSGAGYYGTTSDPLYAAGVYVSGNTLTIQSSIIADNRGLDGQDDLNGAPGTVILGAKNLITSWHLANVSVPGDTWTDCPKLDPLADNGGVTLTHKLRHDSSAIDQGDSGTSTFDQRGAIRVYPDNGIADIGAVEWQPTDLDERIFASGVDGVCDW